MRAQPSKPIQIGATIVILVASLLHSCFSQGCASVKTPDQLQPELNHYHAQPVNEIEINDCLSLVRQAQDMGVDIPEQCI